MNNVYKTEKPLFKIALTLSIIFWLALIVGTVGVALIYILFFFLFYLFAQSAFISYLKGTAVKITPEQFPDLYERIAACCTRLDIDQKPDAYLLHGDGIFNAFATRFLGRNFIALYSDVVDALDDRPGALNFYIGHELGHIQRGHLKWGPILAPALVLPLLGAGYSRAREYTCDHYGFACCMDVDDASYGLAALAAGATRWRTINTNEYAAQSDVSGRFWMSLHELIGDYPWLVKRMARLNSLKSNQAANFPRRNFFAWIFAVFVPRFGVGGGASVLVTFAMIGILAAVAIPAYSDYTTKAHVIAGWSLTENVRAQVLDYAATNRAWPESNTAINLPPQSEQYGPNINTILVGEGGAITVAFTTGKSLVIDPYVVDEELYWQCKSDTIQEKYFPAECK